MKTQVKSTLSDESDGKDFGYLRIPSSTDGSAYGVILVPLIRIRNGAGPRVLIMAGNHGDEYEGQVICAKLAHSLGPGDVKGSLTIVPSLNYPAVKAGRRTSPIDGGNLNRSFPGSPTGSVTEQIAHYVENVLIASSDFVIDLHSGGTSTEFFMPTLVVRRSQDPDRFLQQMRYVKAFGAPLTYLISEATGNDTGVIGACKRQAVDHLTTELGGGGTVSIEGVRVGHDGVLRVLWEMGSLRAHPRVKPEVPTRLMVRGGLHSDDFLHATEDGVFEPYIQLGDHVDRDTIAGVLHSYATPWRTPTEIRFRNAGVVIAKARSGRIDRGDALFVVAQDELPHEPEAMTLLRDTRDTLVVADR